MVRPIDIVFPSRSVFIADSRPNRALRQNRTVPHRIGPDGRDFL
jgi:hypothetical protein